MLSSRPEGRPFGPRRIEWLLSALAANRQCLPSAVVRAIGAAWQVQTGCSASSLLEYRKAGNLLIPAAEAEIDR
jgi:hypothetical protein